MKTMNAAVLVTTRGSTIYVREERVREEEEEDIIILDLPFLRGRRRQQRSRSHLL